MVALLLLLLLGLVQAGMAQGLRTDHLHQVDTVQLDTVQGLLITVGTMLTHTVLAVMEPQATAMEVDMVLARHLLPLRMVVAAQLTPTALQDIRVLEVARAVTLPEAIIRTVDR